MPSSFETMSVSENLFASSWRPTKCLTAVDRTEGSPENIILTQSMNVLETIPIKCSRSLPSF